MSKKVFVAREIPGAGLDIIRRECDCEVWPDRLPPPYEALLEGARGCDGVLALLSDKIDSNFFEAVGPQLKVVSNFAVGVNNIDLEEATLRGVAVGNTPGVLTDATADIAVTLLLAAARGVRHAVDNVSKHEWRTWEPMEFIGQDLNEKTLGIVGMGRIGQAVARRLKFGWDMDVIYSSRSDKPQANKELRASRVSFDELLRQSDFISIHTDLNTETQHLFGNSAFEKMKATSVLVNTARGGVVDESALADALSRKHIFAAGLDVTDPEPLQSDSPLRELSNCIILPHIGSATVSSRNAMAEIAAANLLAGLDGKPLPHPVNA